MRVCLVVVALSMCTASTSFGDVRVKRYDVMTTGPYPVVVDVASRGAVLAFGGFAEVGTSVEELKGLVSLVFWRGSREVVLKPAGKVGEGLLWIYGNGMDGDGVRRYALRVELRKGVEDAHQRYEFFDSRVEEERRMGIVRESFDEYLARLVLEGFGVVETVADEASSELPLSMAFVSLRLGSEIKLVFSATNEGAETVLLEDVRVTDGRPATRNHVGFLRLDAARPDRGLAAIGPGETLHGYIDVSEPLVLGKRAAVTAVAASGKSKSRYIQIWPPRDEPPLPPGAGKMVVGVMGSFGAAQLTSEAQVSDWTSVRGGGLRVTYGVLRWLSVEGSLLAFATGSAGPSDEQATGGRLQAAALVHVGHDWVPFLRLGVGVAAFRQRSDSGSRTRGSFLPVFGLGVQRWLADRVVFSLSGSYATQGGVLDLAVVSLQLGYAWSP